MTEKEIQRLADLIFDRMMEKQEQADIEYAKKIALQGCEQMKKKNKILTECKCEIIYVNNNLVIKE